MCRRVSPAATVWLTARTNAVENVLVALHADLPDTDETAGVTLPAIRCTMGELVAEVAAHRDTLEFAVSCRPDAVLERGFGHWPKLDASLAAGHGFRDDGDLRTLVDSVITDIQAWDCTT